MPELVKELESLPPGSHCISFHSSPREAADHAVDFIVGSPEGQAAAYWVADTTLQTYYRDRLSERAPKQVGCVMVLDHEQVEAKDGKLRPVAEVRAFIGQHPEGVTAAGETLSLYWGPDNIPEHLEYEDWFEQQPRDDSRFLCPYDLRRVPPSDAPHILRQLGRHHSHAVLSDSTEPAVRLLQLFIFGTPSEIPPELRPTLEWADRSGLVESISPSEELRLSPAGAGVVDEWSSKATVDW